MHIDLIFSLVLYSDFQWFHMFFIPYNCFPAINIFKVSNGNTRTMCEICSKLTGKTPERHQWCRFGGYIIDLEQFSDLVLVFPLMTLHKLIPAGLDLGFIFVNLQYVDLLRCVISKIVSLPNFSWSVISRKPFERRQDGGTRRYLKVLGI